MEADDRNLLREYIERRSEEAFAALVRRHLNLVYSVALRQVRSRPLAEDVAQSVFTDLARQAHRLAPDTILAAWLYQVTRRTAIDVVRRESRRQLREQIAVEMTNMNANATDWTQIEPLLDEAMHALDDTDRAAVLLRYFEKKSLREVGATLGTSEEAAQKRVSRAVERLREFFAKRGVTVGASGLAVVISANAVQAAPAGLAAAISSAAVLAGTTIAATTTATITKAIAMTTLQKTIVTAAIVVTAGAGIYEAQQASTLRRATDSLQQQQASLTSQLQQWQRERDDASNRLALLADENAALKNDSADTLKLRGEWSQLKTASAELATAESDPVRIAAKSWADRVAQLKQRLEQTPGAKIPELKYLTDANWLNAARDPLVTDKDYRRAFAQLRSAGENQFIMQIQKALQDYLKASNEQFPSDISQLKSYFETTPDDTMLQRYAIVPASSIPNMKMGGDWLITVKNPVDEEYDSLWALGPKGFGTTTYQGSKEASVLAPALKAYEDAHSGQDPTNPSDLLPYLRTPEQQAAYQKLEQMRNPGGK
jgi:RNA polymerase sigma factor (sigma-70 family)